VFRGKKSWQPSCLPYAGLRTSLDLVLLATFVGGENKRLLMGESQAPVRLSAVLRRSKYHHQNKRPVSEGKKEGAGTEAGGRQKDAGFDRIAFRSHSREDARKGTERNVSKTLPPLRGKLGLWGLKNYEVSWKPPLTSCFK